MNGSLHFGKPLLNFVCHTDHVNLDAPAGGTGDEGDAPVAQIERAQYFIGDEDFNETLISWKSNSSHQPMYSSALATIRSASCSRSLRRASAGSLRSKTPSSRSLTWIRCICPRWSSASIEPELTPIRMAMPRSLQAATICSSDLRPLMRLPGLIRTQSTPWRIASSARECL